MLGRRAHDHLGRGFSPGEEDVVEAFGQEGGGLRDAALNHFGGAGQVFGNPAGQYGRRGRGMFARLEDHGVSRGQGAGERGEQQLQRVVPRPDHQHHAQRGEFGPGAGRPHCQRHRHAAGPQPAFEVPLQVRRLGVHEPDLRELRLGVVLAQVAGEGFGEVRVPLREHAPKPAQLIQPPGERAGGPGVERGPGTADG